MHRNLLSVNDISRSDIENILRLSKEMEQNPDKYLSTLSGKSLAIAFFEPSTRTRIGFSLAMQKLGGHIVEISETKHKDEMSSPESMEDTLKVISDYVDIIALRSGSEKFIHNI